MLFVKHWDFCSFINFLLCSIYDSLLPASRFVIFRYKGMAGGGDGKRRCGVSAAPQSLPSVSCGVSAALQSLPSIPCGVGAAKSVCPFV